jgi:hypothetical protein
MSKLEELLINVEIAKGKVDEAEGELSFFLEPILTVLKATGGGISSVTTSGDNLYIERTGSCRGCRWDDDYKFPLAIFESENPIEAAKKYMDAQQQAYEKAEHQKKLNELKRLQEELGLK